MATDVMQKSPTPGATLVLSLAGDEGIEFKGKRYVPDATKAYFQFTFSHAYPVTTVYGTALHPAVIAKSFNSLENQNVNYEHQIARYHQESGRDVRDHIIGSIVAADFPNVPVGGWKVNPDPEKAPGITGVGTIFKQASSMTKMLGEHASGKHRYTVSMEVIYPLEEAGFIAELPKAPRASLNGARPPGYKDPEADFTPPDLLACGVEYFPFEHAPEELVATFSRKKNRVVARYKGRSTCVLMGGLSNPVHYAGAGIVHFGAEKTAKLMRLAARGEHPAEQVLTTCADSILSAFRKLSN